MHIWDHDHGVVVVVDENDMLLLLLRGKHFSKTEEVKKVNLVVQSLDFQRVEQVKNKKYNDG